MSDKELIWTTDSEKEELDCRIFKVKSVFREAAGNRRGQFTIIDSPDWVTIVPIVRNEQGKRCFLIVRQYRHGSSQLTREFPAGMIDPGEKPLDAAIRELSEETGYRAGKIRQIGKVNPNPAFMSNSAYTYLAEDLVPTGVQNLDEHEMIEMELVPFELLSQKIGEGDYNSAITVQAWYWYLKTISSSLDEKDRRA